MVFNIGIIKEYQGTMNKYQELLERPEWKEKRERILERDGHTCQFCGSTDKQLQVHHFNYDAPTPWDVPDKYLITLCKDCHKNYHFTLLGLRECDKHIPDCDWEGFSIERLKKQGFHINGNHATLKLNGFTLFLTHQGDGGNTAVATLFKDGSQKRYHEDVVATHLMLDDYLEEYLDFDFSTL